MSVSVGLTGLEFSCDLRTAWCGVWGQRLVTASSVERIVAVEAVTPKTIVLLFGFLGLDRKYHLPSAAYSLLQWMWLCSHYQGIWALETAHLHCSGTQAFLGGVGGREKWCHVLCFVSVLHRVSSELGCVVSFVTLIMCGEKKRSRDGYFCSMLNFRLPEHVI